ncbi:AAA family ATPase [Flaviflexus massiliensis]|uniref:AAA family ATPase n=1 Tax=Flaviflexus massiliensis TaxID=1522309 RepID=UPI0006D567E5|nr:AAA family ATPase [Flaviflexus massiliensis]
MDYASNPFFSRMVKTHATSEANPFTPTPVDGPSNYGTAALTSELDILANTMPGGRNHQLNKSAFNISQLIASGHIDPTIAWDALNTVARQIGLTESEIQATLKSAYGAGSAQPRHVDDITPPETVVLQPVPNPNPQPTQPAEPHATETEPVAPISLEDSVREHLPILDWHALWEQDDEEEWILEPLIAKRRGIVIYSPPKVGKSLFSLEMAVHISRGEPWLGTTIDAPHNVLYVDYENDPRGDTRARLQAMGYGPDDLQNLKMLSFPTLDGLDTSKGAQQLLAACQVYECDIVIIDTISRAVDGDENENDTWLAFYRNTGLLLKQNEITMVRLDHTGKDESKGQRGGSAKSGDVDAIWKLSKVTEDGSKLQLKLDDARMQITDRTLILDRITDPLHHKVAGAGQMAAWDAKVNEIIQALDDHGFDRDVGRGKARELLKGLGIVARNETISEAIRQRKNRPYALPIELNQEEK